MDFDFGALLKNHMIKHKARPTQFVSVASGVEKRRDEYVRNRRNTRSTMVDYIRNIPQADVPQKQVKLDTKREKLEKWKQEKEKRKKEIACRKKKPFVIGIVHAPLNYVPPPPILKQMPSTSGRVTRSQTTKKAICTTNMSAKEKNNNKSNIKSFAPENALFCPPKLKINKAPTLEPFKHNYGTEKAIQSFTFNPIVPQKVEQLSKGTSQNLKNKFIKHSEIKAKENEVTTRRTAMQNSKSKSSESEDKCDMEQIKKTRKSRKHTTGKSIQHNNFKTLLENSKKLIHSIPKSESSSEEKLRSPKTPDQTIELNLKSPAKTPPQVTVSRGKDQARREMKMKIEEGFFEEDASDMDNVKHIRRQYESEMLRIAAMCDAWDKISQETELPENIHDLILAAVGQSRLLMTKKLQQFAGLLLRCENPSTDSALVTPADLQGFWDIIYMQIEDIDMRFKKLDEYRANNWIEKQSVEKKKPSKAVKAKEPVRNIGGPSRMREFIAAARKAKKDQEVQVVPVVSPEDKNTSETKTFSGGFFSIRSPVRSPAPATPRSNNSLLKTVLSSEAKKTIRKDNTSYAMLRASIFSKDIELDGITLLPQTPQRDINLFATPGRSILKSGTKSVGKKSIKFLESPTELNKSNIQDTMVTDNNSKENDSEQVPESKMKIDVERNKENDKKDRLVRQDATEFSPIATRSQRRKLSELQTPNLPEQMQESTKKSNKKRKGKTPGTEENIKQEKSKRSYKDKLLHDLEAGLEEISLETPRRSLRTRKSLVMT